MASRCAVLGLLLLAAAAVSGHGSSSPHKVALKGFMATPSLVAKIRAYIRALRAPPPPLLHAVKDLRQQRLAQRAPSPNAAPPLKSPPTSASANQPPLPPPSAVPARPLAANRTLHCEHVVAEVCRAFSAQVCSILNSNRFGALVKGGVGFIPSLKRAAANVRRPRRTALLQVNPKQRWLLVV
jgi:hypothetical protein